MSDGGGDMEDVNYDDDGGGGMTFVEESKDSYCGKLGDAFCGMCFGIFLFFGSIILLFWNEGRAVSRAKDLDEASNEVVSVDLYGADGGTINVKEYEGKLIHVVGPLSTSQMSLKDPVFGVSGDLQGSNTSSSPFLKLQRNVEMYQWKEQATTTTQKTLDGGTKKTTTYNYVKDWSSTYINSNNFRNRQSNNQNPTGMPFDYLSIAANPILLGNQFTLSEEITGYINWFEPVTSVSLASVPDENLRKALTPLPSQYGFYYHTSFKSTTTPPPANTTTGGTTGTTTGGTKNRFLQGTLNGTDSTNDATNTTHEVTSGSDANGTTGVTNTTTDTTSSNTTNSTTHGATTNGATASNNTGSTLGGNSTSTIPSKPIPSVPSVGDSRITFAVVPADTVTIVAQYSVRGTLESSRTKRDGSILLFERGSYTAQEMFDQAEEDNTTVTWVLRFVGFILMFVSVLLILQPLSTAMDIIPFVGDMIGDGMECCIFPTIAFFVSFPISMLVIAIAWIVYRPLIAIPLVLVFGAAVGWVCYRGYEKVQEQQQQQEQSNETNKSEGDIPVVTGTEEPQKNYGGGGFAQALDG